MRELFRKDSLPLITKMRKQGPWWPFYLVKAFNIYDYHPDGKPRGNGFPATTYEAWLERTRAKREGKAEHGDYRMLGAPFLGFEKVPFRPVGKRVRSVRVFVVGARSADTMRETTRTLRIGVRKK